MLRRSRSRNVTGLVIEPGFVAAASVAVNGHIALDQAAVRPLEADVVRDGEVVNVDALAETLRDIWRETKGLSKHVRIGVANARIVVRILELPPVEDDKTLAAAVRFQAEQELPIPLDQAVLDFQRLETVETPAGPRLRCLVVVARRELVTGLLEATRAAGLKPAGVDLSAFGMVRALEEGPEPKLYLTIGGLTNMAVSVDGTCIFTRVTSTSLEGIAETLAARCGLPLDEARGWLREAGTKGRTAPAVAEPTPTPAPAPTPKPVNPLTAGLLEEDLAEAETEIVEPTLVVEPTPVVEPEPEEGSPLVIARGALLEGIRQIAGEIRSSLDFFHGQSLGTPVVASGVLTGPAAAIPGFAEALSTELGLEVVARSVETSSGVGPVDPYEVTVAAGLAIEEAPVR
jgi:type IV pilus assembly protein PilM